jgi:hypothetical protein
LGQKTIISVINLRKSMNLAIFLSVKAKKGNHLKWVFALCVVPLGGATVAVPLTRAYHEKAAQASPPSVPSQKIENSIYGDISLKDWEWSRAQAVREALIHKHDRDEYLRLGGQRDNFQWQRPQNLLYKASQSNQKLLIIDLGHYDYTERANHPASGAQASDGMTEAEFVDIQGRALFNEANRMGYRVVFIRAPDEAMRVTEFNDFSMDERKSYYARTRGAQIDFIAQRLGFSPDNTRAVSLHMDRSDVLSAGENAELLRGTAVYVNVNNQTSIDFARAIANNIPDHFIAPYVRHNDGIFYTTTLALPKGAAHVPTILLESEFMTDHPTAVDRRRQVVNDNGTSWARWFMEGVEDSFPRAPQTRVALNTVGEQSQTLR